MRVVFFAVIICKIINFANDFSGMTSKSFHAAAENRYSRQMIDAGLFRHGRNSPAVSFLSVRR